MIGGADREAFLELERQDKQNYLQTQIVDLGYDTNWFSQFLSEKRGNFHYLSLRKWNGC